MKIKPGEVVEFHYTQSDPDKIRLGKVQYVRDTESEPLEEKTLRYSQYLRRSRYLLTMLMADGTYRQFYDCALTGLKKVGMIRRSLLYLSGVRFEPAKPEGFEAGKV